MSANEDERGARLQRTRKKIDRRILRTRDRLGDALIELIQEKPFDSVTVQDVLERASVARSTFYTHYSDKADLLLSDMDDFLELMASGLSRAGEKSNRVAPVREFFAHVAEARKLYAALAEAGRVQDFLDLARGHFARGIERRLAEVSGAPRAADAESRAAVAHALAGALIALLTWWIDRGMRGATPEQLDELYHRLVWSGVGA